MVLSSLQRLLPSFEQVHIEWMGGCKRLVQLLLDECSNDNDTGIMDYSATHRMRRAKEEHWTLEKRGDTDEKIITNEHDNEAKDKAHHLQQQLQQLPIILQQLKTTATTTIPQIISRILHATPPIMHEISRGYFVPFLTVALACLGRIHTLLLRMGRDVVGMLQESVPQLQKVLIIGDDRSNSNSAMKKKSVMQVVGKDAIMDWKMLYELITPGTFHVDTDPKQNTGKGPAASQEWNRLLNHFVETSQVEITKQMNELVKEKRWTDALARFGIGKDTTSSSSAEDNNIMSGSVERMHTESAVGDDDGNGDDAGQSLLEKRGEESNRDESSSLDMGELVNDTQQPTTDDTMKSSSLENAVDDNMARIIQREKTKRQNTALASSSMAVKSTAAPKKKRKKKKKKSAGAATSHDGNQGESIDTTEAVPADKPSAPMSHVGEGLSPNRKKMAEAIQPSSGDGMSDSSAVTKQPPDSASIPSKESKKTKKKSSKKKSKKQKRKSSSNAIDDIFGL